MRAVLDLGRTAVRRALAALGFEVRRPPKTLIKRPEAHLSVSLEHLIAQLLLDGTDVFVVQIGAFDGRTGDQLHNYIERYCWRGILVEPQPKYFAELRRTYAGRSGLTLRNVAVSDRRETRILYAIRDDIPGLPDWAAQIASFDRDRLASTGFQGPDGESAIQEHEVECLPLGELLADVERIDVLQIDAEGDDAAIIGWFDFSRYLPSIVRFENVTLSRGDHDAAIRRLVDQGYRVAVSGVDTVAWHD